MVLPKISIVTPSFNQAEFLEATIQSVLSQNYPNLEYIIIDGGSTDNSIEIIKRYESHLYFWCSEPDGGQYEAINKGFSHATGEIMAWLNSDDLYCPWALKTIASILTEQPEIEWITTLNRGVWDWHGHFIRVDPTSGYSREAFLEGCYLPGSQTFLGTIQQESTFWRRSLWKKVGGLRTQYRLAGDFDLWAQFCPHTELYATASPLGGFRLQQHQRSRQIEQYILEAGKSLAEAREALNWSPDSKRQRIRQLNLHKLPKLRQWVNPFYVYQGKRVSRQNPAVPEATWQIEAYSFS
jgi:glycosyltransferase involved in cell wall biosynthesis